jgi:hypothetical protein
MSTTTMPERSNRLSGLPRKLVDSVFAATALAVACWNLLGLARLFGPNAESAAGMLIQRSPFWMVGPLLGVVYALYWQARDASADFSSERRHARTVTIVRYVVAFVIASYGFTKVVGIQFYLGMNWQDQPASELNGFMLTWYYFYRSRTLVLIIAGVEIIGSAFLLVPRLALLGAAMLLPVMVNVTLTDYLYDIRGPAPAALYLTLALVYLVWPYHERIAQLLFHSTPAASGTTRSASAALLPAAVMLLAFLSVAVWVTPLGRHTAVPLHAGKWRVDRQVVNGKAIAPDRWAPDTTTSTWFNVYLEDGYLTASAQPNLFDPKRARWGSYTYDEAKHSMAVKFDDKDAGTLTVDTLAGDHMALHGTLSGDTVALSLTRVRPMKWYRVHWGW